MTRTSGGTSEGEGARRTRRGLAWRAAGAVGVTGVVGAGVVALLAACAPGGDASARRSAGAASAGASAAAAPAGGGEAFRPLAPGDTAPAYAAPAVFPAALAGRGDSLRVGPGAAAAGPTLVNVWATWCTSCREEFALLDSLERTYGPRGLRVVAVSVDRGPAARVARFAASQGTTFAIAHDPEGRVEEAFRVVGVPESYLVGRDGRVLWRHPGALGPDARQAVERALR